MVLRYGKGDPQKVSLVSSIKMTLAFKYNGTGLLTPTGGCSLNDQKRGVIFMPRGARIKSPTGIYHIMMRGINRQILFEQEEESVKLIQTLQKYREICEYTL